VASAFRKTRPIASEKILDRGANWESRHAPAYQHNPKANSD